MEPIEPDRVVRKTRLNSTSWKAPFIGPELNRVVQELVRQSNAVQRQVIVELARQPLLPPGVQLAMTIQELTRHINMPPFSVQKAINDLFEP